MTLTMKLGLSTLCLVVLLAVTEGQWKKKTGDGGYVPQDPKDPRWRKMLEEVLKNDVTNPPTIPYKPIEEIGIVEILELYGATFYRMTYSTPGPWVTVCQITFFERIIGEVNYEVEEFHCFYAVQKGKKSTHH